MAIRIDSNAFEDIQRSIVSVANQSEGLISQLTETLTELNVVAVNTSVDLQETLNAVDLTLNETQIAIAALSDSASRLIQRLDFVLFWGLILSIPIIMAFSFCIIACGVSMIRKASRSTQKAGYVSVGLPLDPPPILKDNNNHV